MEFTKVSFKNYIPDKMEKPTFLNMRKDNQGNQFPATIAKLYNENNIVCALKTPL